MRGSTAAIALVVACAAAFVSAGAAKGPVRPVPGSVCGANGRTRGSGFSLRVAGTPTFYRHVAPEPFYIVRFHVEPSDFLVGTSKPIIYAPRHGLWRVTIDGTAVWFDVPSRDRDLLRRAVVCVRPYRAPRSWTAVVPR